MQLSTIYPRPIQRLIEGISGKISRIENLTQSLILLGVASCGLIAWWLTNVLGYTADSTTYVNFSSALVGRGPVSASFFFRTPGYPLLMVLTGVPFIDSFAGLLLIQAAMALAIPLLLYQTLTAFSPRIAFFVALSYILTFNPFLYSKYIMTEQMFVFLTVLLLYFLGRLYVTRDGKFIYWAGGTGLLLGFVRPSAVLVSYIALAATCILSRKFLRPAITMVALIFATNAAWSFVVSLYITPALTGSAFNRIITLPFQYVYTKSLVTRSNGPASLELHAALESFTRSRREMVIALQPSKYFRFGSESPRDIATALLEKPNQHYFLALQSMLQTPYSVGELSTAPGRLLFYAALEAFRSHPWQLFGFIQQSLLSSSASFAGQQLFYQGYVAGRSSVFANSYDMDRVLVPQAGPASQEIFRLLREFLEIYPQFWETREPAYYFSRHAGNPERLIADSILNDANIHTYWFLWNVMDTMVGPIESARLFRAASLELIWRHPPVLLVLADNFVTFLFGPVTTNNSGVRRLGLHTFRSPNFDDPTLPRSLRDEITKVPLFDIRNQPFAQYLYGFLFLLFKPLLLVTILMTALFALRSSARWLFCVSAIMFLYHAAVVAIFAEPLTRYVDQILPVSFLLAGLGIGAALNGEPRQNPSDLTNDSDNGAAS